MKASFYSPQWGGALRDDTKNCCVADFSVPGFRQSDIFVETSNEDSYHVPAK